MNCEICERPHHESRLPFICAVDARNLCYEDRVRHLQVCMEGEATQSQIEQLLRSDPRAAGGSSKASGKIVLSDRKAAEDRTSQIVAQAEKLRGDIIAARDEISRLKDGLARRGSELSSSTNGLASRRVKQLEETERRIVTLRHHWKEVADDTARTRSFLCMEAAKLYGLRRVRRGSSRYEYKLGGIDVIDLTSMNSLSPELISTSLAHVAHILMLTSHYLSIRLPAEIITPRRDHARPAIYALSSSYQSGTFRSRHVSDISDAAHDDRGGDFSSGPRPRPLFIEKPLITLAKDDVAAHSFFLEGATLLAYDVAWLCLSQNISIGDRLSFDDVCNMGRNLYNLLIGSQLRNNNNAVETEGNGELEETKLTNLMGRHSHGSTHNFLGGAAGSDFIRSFKLPSPMKLVDKLKKKLGSDLAIPEWEVVENGDWDDGGV